MKSTMRRVLVRSTLAPAVLLFAAVAAVAASGQSGESAPKAVAGAMDARAEEILRSACKTLAAAKMLSFHVRSTEAVVNGDTGRIVHYTAHRYVSLARPDRLAIEARDGMSRHRLWFAGGRLTVLDPSTGRAGVGDVPKTIDGMLDHLYEEYDLVMPVADLLYSDPCDGLEETILSGRYLGEATVSNRRCHHLAFRSKDVDWQMWIDTRGEPLTRKIVITYKDEPGRPQFTMRLDEWDLSAQLGKAAFEPVLQLGKAAFEPVLPDGTQEVDLAEFVRARQSRGGAR